MPKLSAIVITYNEERNIERCLRSIQWTDEIIVVDSFSTDRTVELAKSFTSHILQHEYDGDIAQRERGFGQATGDWLFYIDADEEVSLELKDDVRREITSATAKDGYLIPRAVSIFGKWIYHGGWYPDYTLRLFRRGKYFPKRAEVHGGFAVRGETGTLKGQLYHYTYETIEQYVSKMNDYTSLQVSDKLNTNPSMEVGTSKIVLSPLSHFVRKYVSNKGYRDGIHGFVLAVLGAIYTLSLYAKIWEYRMRKREGRGLMPPITNLELRNAKRL
ncbi:MAG: glycosyltransferase family 2 protein [Ignavibacteria bacterium]|nr:glycosyltransferase family 2 protein [Ignavibacteria bacterium]MBI3765028.1 glycosyltransferase family 2 protein [Ignavibacteriales bacterium]